MSDKISNDLISIGEVSIPFYEDNLIGHGSKMNILPLHFSLHGAWQRYALQR